jgi:hypothetical protein
MRALLRPLAEVPVGCRRCCGSILCVCFSLLPGIEPAPKRSRLGMVQSAFIFKSTTPKPDGTLCPPKLLELVVNGEKNEVRCDGCSAHGSWMLLLDVLTVTFHHAGGANVKKSVFRHIEGTEAWLQTNCGHLWQGVLILYFAAGTLEQVLLTEAER